MLQTGNCLMGDNGSQYIVHKPLLYKVDNTTAFPVYILVQERHLLTFIVSPPRRNDVGNLAYVVRDPWWGKRGTLESDS